MLFLIISNLLFVSLSFGYGEGAATTNSEIPAQSLAADSVASEKKYEIFQGIPTCNQNDANLNDCLRRVFQAVQPRFKDGNKELNIPSIDPFALNRTTFEYKNGGIKGRITVKDALIYGFQELKFEDLDFKINGDKISYVAKVSLPAINIIGNYKADIDFNSVKLKPRGTFNLTMTEVNIAETAEGELYENDGHRFMRLNKLDAQPVIGNLNLNATGLFPDPELSELVLSVTNQYWRQIYSIMLPETKKYWAPMLLRLINESLAEVPFDLFVKNK